MLEKFKILFIGDIVGRSGRNVVRHFLVDEDLKSQYDFIIANVENVSHGFGLTKKNHDELIECGVTAMTSGNHIWDKKDILSYIDESPVLIRPYNYHKSIPGVGYRIFDNIIVINLLGKTFMSPINCPFSAFEMLMNELKSNCDINDKIIFVDFHAEATAEKQCFAKFASELGANVVFGTHTHVQTADETIIDSKFAYITDVGFCGSKNGIIGMEYSQSLKLLLTSIKEKFEVELSFPYIFNACEVAFEKKVPISIKRINLKYENTDEGVAYDN